MKKKDSMVKMATPEEFIEYVSKYINDLPDKCPHKTIIKACRDFIIQLLNAISFQEKIIDNQKACIETLKQLGVEYKKLIQKNEIDPKKSNKSSIKNKKIQPKK
jgi:hypothetical protein